MEIPKVWQCPDCGTELQFGSGCYFCPSCGYGQCGKYKPSIRQKCTALGVVLMLIIGMGVAGHEQNRKPDVLHAGSDCTQCHNRKASFTAYFKQNGSKTPEQMADAVLATESPRLLAAIAKVESNGSPSAKHKTSKAKGAFQVKEKFWGKVSKDPVQQALQAESILTELTQTMTIEKALDQYGGSTDGRYSRAVLAELQAVPR